MKHSDIPEVEHWAIIETENIFIPGDERSKTNPGHGYPASIESVIKYSYFTSEAALQHAIKNKASITGFRVVKVTPLKLGITTDIKLHE